MNLRIDRWVIAQAILFILFIYAPRFFEFENSRWLLNVAKLLLILGLAIGIVAIFNLRHSLAVSPEPVENGTFVTTGIYHYVRHPMYCAVWLILLGLAIQSENGTRFIVLAVIVLFFSFKSQYEEKQLQKVYKDYKRYMDATGAFVPKLTKR